MKNPHILLFIILCSISTLFGQSKIIGYYPSWMRYTLPANEIQYKNLTHINHAFAWPDANGNLKMDTGFVYSQLNNSAHQNGVKVLISLGGWGNSGGFAPMAADSVKRANFINNLTNFILTNNYDGADLDWEFPETISDKNNLTTLVRELRERFDMESQELLITMAVPISNWSGQWFDFSNLIKYVNWFNAMCYDIHGSWSAHSGHNAPLYQPVGDSDGAVNTALAYLHNTRGIPKDQLTVGMPFYGKQFISSALYSSFTLPVTDLLYNEIAPKINNGWTYNWDDVSKVPYLKNNAGTQLITFDDTVSVRYKCSWIKEQGYSGAMIWALGQDKIGSRQFLLETIAANLLTGLTTLSKQEKVYPQSFTLKQNYPNPFNPTTTIEIDLRSAAVINLSIYNSSGELIQILADGEFFVGTHKFIFDATGLASGEYYYKLGSNGMDQVFKMVLLK